MNMANQHLLKNALHLYSSKLKCQIPGILTFLEDGQITNLSENTLTRILNDIQFYIDLFNELKFEKNPSDFNKDLLLAGLKYLNLYALDDVVSKVSHEDIVEIYDMNGVQKFRNLTFHKFCSYDLITLYSQPYFELYSRSSHINDQLMAFFNFTARNAKGTIPFSVGPHILSETFGDKSKKFKVWPKLASPLKDEAGETKAILISNFCQEFTLT